AQEWIDTYGTNTQKIYERVDATPSDNPSPKAEQHLRALIDYAIEEEMAVTAVDFLRLRTGWTDFQLKKAEENAEAVLRYMGQKLGWDEKELEQQREAVNQLFETIHNLPERDET
ncbi:hypothetical protein MXD81_14885, partial [Microbacteriaceae bacterium K1510]|nr:hypothetical protein [Microbacteriaceae bacterium K1510]